ncbi:MAG: hypothetical protein NUV53_02365 [Patescibacteria group bacterium]|nr:hypothetical protein [Patescibacteria group bacterium]
MSDFRKPREFGGNRGENRFGRRNSDRPSFGNRPTGPSRNGGGDFHRPEMHRAVCSKCGNSCEVPFRPNGKKPVYCSECFGNTTRSTPSDNFQRRDSNTPSPAQPQARDTRIDDLKGQMDAVQSKLDKILKIIESHSHSVAPIIVPEKVSAPKEEKKKATAVKKSPAKKKNS